MSHSLYPLFAPAPFAALLVTLTFGVCAAQGQAQPSTTPHGKRRDRPSGDRDPFAHTGRQVAPATPAPTATPVQLSTLINGEDIDDVNEPSPPTDKATAPVEYTAPTTETEILTRPPARPSPRRIASPCSRAMSGCTIRKFQLACDKLTVFLNKAGRQDRLGGGHDPRLRRPPRWHREAPRPRRPTEVLWRRHRSCRRRRPRDHHAGAGSPTEGGETKRSVGRAGNGHFRQQNGRHGSTGLAERRTKRQHARRDLAAKP